MTKTAWTAKLACLSAIALAWGCSDDNNDQSTDTGSTIDLGTLDTGNTPDMGGTPDMDNTPDMSGTPDVGPPDVGGMDAGGEDTGADTGTPDADGMDATTPDMDGADTGADAVLVTAYQLSDESDAMHPAVGTAVRLEGLMLTALGTDDRGNPHAFAQDPMGGAHSGLYLDIDDALVTALSAAVPGITLIDVEGSYVELFDELVAVEVTSWSIAAPTVTPVEPLVVTPRDLADPATAEAHEGVFVRVEDVFVTAENADAAGGNDFGEFEIDALLRVNDLLYQPAMADLETNCDRLAYVQGPLNVSFGNYKIEPRDAGDLSITARITPESAPSVAAGDDVSTLAICAYAGAGVELDNGAGTMTAVLQSVDAQTGVALMNPVFLASAAAGMSATAGPLAPGVYTVGPGQAAGDPVGYVVILSVDDPNAGVLAPGDLVITEFMANPDAVGDDKGEYIEIFNPTGAPIDLKGIKLQDKSGMNRGTFVIPTAYTLAPDAYVVIARSDVTTENGGVDAAFAMGNALQLGNGGDFIEILDTADNLIDRVEWGSSSSAMMPLSVTAGASLQVSPMNPDANTNDDPTNWCTSATAWTGSAGDFGTPGAANDCP